MVKIKAVVAALAVAVALIGYLPLFPYLDPLARWFFPLALALGIFLERKGRSPGGKILTPLSMLLFLYYAMGFSLESVVAVTSNLLIVLLAVRMLGEKSGRNYLQIFALSLFSLAASSLYTLSALFLGYLLVLLLLLAVSLVVLTFEVQDRETVLTSFQLKRVLSVSLLMPVVSVPTMLLLFFVLPRTPYPMWSFLNGGAGRQVGFTDTVRPGASSSLNTPKNVAFRAVCPKLPEAQLYWRGIVLNSYSGDSWVRLSPEKEEEARLPSGPSVEQEIFPEPSAANYVVALNLPRIVGGIRHDSFPDQVFTASFPANKRVSYRAYSVLTDTLEAQRIDRPFYLALPKTISTRLRAEARVLSREADAQAKIAALERFFRSRRLSYANADLPVGRDPLDLFLFEKRRGNCEYFASSCALLLRLCGVPARLVGGYHGGSYSDVGGYYLVTEDTAHVWVEAYLDGKGWVKIDPSEWSRGFARSEGFAAKARVYLDLLGFYWNKAVVTYDLEKQLSLVRLTARKVRNFSPPKVGAKALLQAALLLAACGWLWYRLGRRPLTPEEKLLRAFFRVVERRYPGLAARNSGIYELSRGFSDPGLKEFVSIYGSAVYRDRPLDEGEYRRCRDLLREARKRSP